jgi:hypothetical protein
LRSHSSRISLRRASSFWRRRSRISSNSAFSSPKSGYRAEQEEIVPGILAILALGWQPAQKCDHPAKLPSQAGPTYRVVGIVALLIDRFTCFSLLCSLILGTHVLCVFVCDAGVVTNIVVHQGIHGTSDTDHLQVQQQSTEEF